ncbi:unnamed protein product [Larinioides sclopetarius]|uniref:BTB domain-containing protein n=1 Tax=Larinioides sclopetarius TaxID=280406 RepID=A0AAV2BBB2_9ARAC
MSVEVEQAEEEKPMSWQKSIRSLREGIAHIYETKEFADVHLVVGARTFKAHRLILAARSPEFLKMLQKQSAASPTIREIINDVTEDGFEILLRFIYTDQVDDLDQDKLLGAYRAASRFKQKGLLKVCEERIAQWEITCENVCALLNELADIDSMVQRCLLFVRNNALSVLTAESLTQASPNTIWLMFEKGFFKHAPAMTRLKNALRWAAEQLPPQNDYKMARDILLQSKPILGKCGIEKLNSVELANVIAQYKNLLTPEECTAFFVNANSPGAMDLPKWCKPDD